MPTGAQVRGRGLNQGDIVDILQALANRTLTKTTLAVNAGGAATVKTTGNPPSAVAGFTCEIQGIKITKADLSAQAITGAAPLAAAGQNVPANRFAMMRVEIDAAGVIGTVQGGNFPTSAQCQADPPQRSASKATIGYIVMNNGAAVFVPGTTALDVAGVTFFDGDPDLQTIFLPA